MNKKVLTIFDLEDLYCAAEYIISSAQFNFWQFDDEGNEIAFRLPKEERLACMEKWIEEEKNHYLCFRYNAELHKIGPYDAMEMPLAEVKEKYLKNYLKKLRMILRHDTADTNNAVVSDDVPDSYLDNLLALRWRGNLVLWAMQWKNETMENKEG